MAAEEEHLRMTFQMNGYPKGFIAGALRPRRGQDETQQGEETTTEEPTPGGKTLCVLPYVRGTSDKLVEICRKLGVHPVFQ